MTVHKHALSRNGGCHGGGCASKSNDDGGEMHFVAEQRGLVDWKEEIKVNEDESQSGWIDI